MRLYALYVLLIASIVAATPGLNERLRRWLIIGVALLVIAPVTLFLLFG
jgi:cation transport ATPase